MQATAHIWFNGHFVPWNDAQVHVLTHALHYGSGVFEGLRAYATPKGPAVLALDAHVERLFRSCKVVEMDLPWTPEQISHAILQTVSVNNVESCYVRPLAFRGYGELGVMPSNNPTQLVIACFPWGSLHGTEALENGIDVGVSSWRRMAPDTHPGMAKVTGNYVNSQLVVAEAVRHGYAEGIVLDTDGFACECSGENIFLYLDGKLLTPPLGESVLPGITRGLVIQLAAELGIPVQEQRVAREMLYFADEILLTGTAAEITPVRSVDHRPVGTGRPGDVTRQLQNEFFAILNGKSEDRHGWLTLVPAQALA